VSEVAPEPDLVSTPEAARLLGLPEQSFTHLVRCLRLEPARAGSRTQPRLWSRTLVEQLTGHPELLEVRGMAQRRQDCESLSSVLEGRYPDWRSALRPAAEALFSLNRYSKWDTCPLVRRTELYSLKLKVLHVFHELSLAQTIRIQSATDVAIDCDICQASGHDWRGQACRHCDGRGHRLGLGRLEFVSFDFVIDGQLFRWHLPRKSASWTEQIEAPEEQPGESRGWQPGGAEEKPIQLSPEQFLEAEACLRFVLARHHEEQEKKRKDEARARWQQYRQEREDE
jgi:hypothetical protein